MGIKWCRISMCKLFCFPLSKWLIDPNMCIETQKGVHAARIYVAWKLSYSFHPEIEFFTFFLLAHLFTEIQLWILKECISPHERVFTESNKAWYALLSKSLHNFYNISDIFGMKSPQRYRQKHFFQHFFRL